MFSVGRMQIRHFRRFRQNGPFLAGDKNTVYQKHRLCDPDTWVSKVNNWDSEQSEQSESLILPTPDLSTLALGSGVGNPSTQKVHFWTLKVNFCKNPLEQVVPGSKTHFEQSESPEQSELTPDLETNERSGFQKGGFGGCSPVPKTGTRVHADVPQYQKPERGHIHQNRPFTKPPFCFLSKRALSLQRPQLCILCTVWETPFSELLPRN